MTAKELVDEIMKHPECWDNEVSADYQTESGDHKELVLFTVDFETDGRGWVGVCLNVGRDDG